MEKNKLDKFFADKLSERQIEFDPAHWEAAEKLIDQQEQSGKRRFAWWLLLLPLLAVGAYFGFFQKAESDNGNTKNDLYNTSIYTNSKLDNIEQTSTTKISTQPETKNTTATEQLNTASTNTKTIDSKLPNTTIQTNNTNTISNNKTQKTTESTTTINASSGSETSINPTDAVSNPAPYDAPVIDSNSSDPATKNIKRKGNSLPQANNSNSKPAIQDKSNNPTVSEPDEAVVKSEMTTLEVPGLLAILDPLPAAERGTPMITPHTRKKLSWGVTAGSQFYKGKGQIQYDPATQTNTTINNNFKVGFTAGLTGAYRLSRRFSVNADALYLWSKENIDAVGSANDDLAVLYSFGQVSQVSETKAESFHSVQMPLSLQYNLGRHGLEGGLAFRYLLRVKGEENSTSSTQRSDGSADLLEGASNEVWVPKDNFNRFTTSYFAGYRFAVNDQLNFGLRAFYTPSAQAASDATETSALSIQSNNLSFNIGLKYYFNKRNPYQSR